ncbi:MAG: MBOAT family protein [Cyanobacteria bacterium SZAS TMP-1]|nr:MBOAT family protein [Cyanobacteria bacterium SZAS TMP-1]
MLFTSLSYLIFFPVVFALYWLAPQAWRRALLLVASYVFYMSWIPTYGLLLFLLTAFNYALGLIMDANRARVKSILTFGLVANIGALAYFKYTNFLLDSLKSTLAQLEPWLKLPVHADDIVMMNVILPLGISFFVFEFIHYLVDIYRGDKPIKSPIDFALFASFFPSQIAGPIKRFQDFEHQLTDPRPLNANMVHNGLTLILQGLFKKVALSDNLAPLVTAGYAHVHNMGTADAWLASIGFTLLVYLDFSGYTDMGRGSAMLLGFKLPDNFDLPYFSTSLGAYWRRWHISLGSWLRDYLYIPLGGNRVSRLRRHINLFITMTLGGLWHGAAWHYVIWGAMHGAGLAVNQEYDAFARDKPLLQRIHGSVLGKLFGVALTSASVNFSLVVFRSKDMQDAMVVYGRMLGLYPSTGDSLVEAFLAGTLPVGLVAYMLYFALTNHHRLPVLKNSARYAEVREALTGLCGWPTRIAVYAGSFLAALGFAPTSTSPFIYFQF